jgi:hypothetical protein
MVAEVVDSSFLEEEMPSLSLEEEVVVVVVSVVSFQLF